MLDGPALDKVRFDLSEADTKKYPFSLPILKGIKEIVFPSKVTFFVGENGAGKSTILESVALLAGLGSEGGNKNINFKTSNEKFYKSAENLASCMVASWRKKPVGANAYFFRAESFFNLANHIDYLAAEGGEGPGKAYAPYGGKSLHEQSHGESFLTFFNNRLNKDGFYILDEPEAALSPQRQLSLLVIIHRLCKDSDSQFIIATHSPILLAYPEATIYSCDGKSLEKIGYKDSKQYEVTKNFLDNPDQYLRKLFD